MNRRRPLLGLDPVSPTTAQRRYTGAHAPNNPGHAANRKRNGRRTPLSHLTPASGLEAITVWRSACGLARTLRWAPNSRCSRVSQGSLIDDIRGDQAIEDARYSAPVDGRSMVGRDGI